MNVIFCSSCGKKHEYTYAVANFCSGCGTSLRGNRFPSSPVVGSAQKPADEEDEIDENDNTSVSSVPQIRKLDLEIEKFEGHNSFTLGSLFNSPQEPSAISRRRNTSLGDFINTKKNRGED